MLHIGPPRPVHHLERDKSIGYCLQGQVASGLKGVLLGRAQLREALRAKSDNVHVTAPG